MPDYRVPKSVWRRYNRRVKWGREGDTIVPAHAYYYRYRFRV